MHKLQVWDTDGYRIDLAPTAFTLQFKSEEVENNQICQTVETAYASGEIVYVEKTQPDGSTETTPYIVVLRNEEAGVVTFTLDDAEHPALGSHDAWR